MTKKKDRVSGQVENIVSGLWIWFAVNAGYWFISAIMNIFSSGFDKAFSRIFLSIFCQAIAAILYKMESR